MDALDDSFAGGRKIPDRSFEGSGENWQGEKRRARCADGGTVGATGMVVVEVVVVMLLRGVGAPRVAEVKGKQAASRKMDIRTNPMGVKVVGL